LKLPRGLQEQAPTCPTTTRSPETKSRSASSSSGTSGSPSNHGPAEACFRQALDVARQQGANAWELRAATSLGRLLARARRQSEAQQTLGEVYSRFAEGFDTTDIKDAKALLDQLAT